MRTSPATIVVTLLLALTAAPDVARAQVMPDVARAEGLLARLDSVNVAEEAGRFAAAARHLRRVYEVAEGDPTPLYLVARNLTRAGDRAGAIAALRQAIADGFVPRWPLPEDTTLRALRTHRAWPALVRQAARAAAARDTALRRELLELARRDQEGRRGIDSVFRAHGVPSPQADSAIARMTAIDTVVQARLRAIVAVRGWPGRRLVGDDAAHAAWLLVQHMEPEHQRPLLPLIRAAVRRGDARAADGALLEDRLGTADGKPQRYGSQLRPPKPGAPPELYPIDRPECVERRRAAVKLPPLASYLAMMGAETVWTPPTKRCTER